MGKKINISVVGLGFMGKKHIECYSEMENVNLVAAVDMNIEKIKMDMGYEFNLYRTIDEMLENETPDAVDICLPTFFHREAVSKALEHGSDVLVEKPFALETSEIDEMMECSLRNKKRIMVAHVCRFMHEYIFAKEIITGNVLGKPLFYYGCRNSSTPGWSVNNWLADKKFSGGTVMDLQIHDIDIANWLLGEPVDYRMAEVNNPALGTANFGHVVSIIKYINDKTAVLEAGHLMPDSYPFYTAYRLVCENGVIEFSKGNSVNFNMYKGNERIDMSEEYNARYAGSDPYRDELNHFIDCLRSGRSFAVPTEDARKAVETVNKLVKNSF